MHEVSVVADMIASIKNELEKYNVLSVKSVTLIVGKLTNLGEEQMEFAFEILTNDSIMEGSKLFIEKEEIAVKCDKCGYSGPVRTIEIDESMHLQMPVLSCPECNGSVVITAGKTCCVKHIEIEEADD